MHKSAST